MRRYSLTIHNLQFPRPGYPGQIQQAGVSLPALLPTPETSPIPALYPMQPPNIDPGGTEAKLYTLPPLIAPYRFETQAPAPQLSSPAPFVESRNHQFSATASLWAPLLRPADILSHTNVSLNVQYRLDATQTHVGNRKPTRTSGGGGNIAMATSNQRSTEVKSIKDKHGRPRKISVKSRIDADERRRRNAAASVRFRTKRREREQSASMYIAALKQVMRNLEEKDFWKAKVLQNHPERSYPHLDSLG